VAARDFFLAPLTTTIEPDEMLCAIRFPLSSRRMTWGFQELCRRPGDFAIAAAACQLALDQNGVCSSAAVAVGGVHDTPLYLADCEKILNGWQGEEEAITEAAETAASLVDPPSDVHGSSKFRRKMVRVLVARALKEAWKR
jgi:CO/xanthine dehydrogenase FAD-binding subunit